MDPSGMDPMIPKNVKDVTEFASFLMTICVPLVSLAWWLYHRSRTEKGQRDPTYLVMAISCGVLGAASVCTGRLYFHEWGWGRYLFGAIGMALFFLTFGAWSNWHHGKSV
jgi:hypothetical protein